MSTPSDHRAAEQAAIQAIFNRLVACWNQADGVGYGQLFTADADYIDVTGTRTRGGEAIGRLHQFLFDGPLKGSKLAGGGAPVEVQYLAPDVALVIGGGSSQLAGQEQAPDDRSSINTTVLVRHDGEWRIRAFQNNRILPPSPFTAPGRS